MNGERSDILYNTEQPILCDECKGKFKSKQVELEIISQFEKELKRIKKTTFIANRKVDKTLSSFCFIDKCINRYNS